MRVQKKKENPIVIKALVMLAKENNWQPIGIAEDHAKVDGAVAKVGERIVYMAR